MALTRKSLKAMGLTDEQVDSIVEMHTETIDALKKERDDLREKAGQYDTVKKELDDLKNGKDWKAEHDAVKRRSTITKRRSPKRKRQRRKIKPFVRTSNRRASRARTLRSLCAVRKTRSLLWNWTETRSRTRLLLMPLYRTS